MLDSLAIYACYGIFGLVLLGSALIFVGHKMSDKPSKRDGYDGHHFV